MAFSSRAVVLSRPSLPGLVKASNPVVLFPSSGTQQPRAARLSAGVGRPPTCTSAPLCASLPWGLCMMNGAPLNVSNGHHHQPRLSVSPPSRSSGALRKHTGSLVMQASPADSDMGGGGGGGGDIGGGGNGDSGDGSRGGGGGAWGAMAIVALLGLLPVVQARLGGVVTRIGNFINQIPLPVLTPFLMAIASLLAAIITVWNQRDSSAKSRAEAMEEAAMQRREQLANDRQMLFKRYSQPLLRAAGGLQHALFLMHKGYVPSRDDAAVEYVAYELGVFLGILHILKQMSPTFSFGHPSADRIRGNLLRGVEDSLSLPMSQMEQYESRDESWMRGAPDAGDRGEIFRVSRAMQRSLGELMLTARWEGKCTPAGTVVIASSVVRGDQQSVMGMTASDCVIKFADFRSLLDTNKTFAAAWRPILHDIERLMPEKHGAGRTEAFKTARRVGLVQQGLLDLLDFMDPEPFCRIVQMDNRHSILPRLREKMPGVLRQLSLQPEIDRLLASSNSNAVARGMALSSKDSAAEAKNTLWGQFQRWQARRNGRPEWQVEDASEHVPQVFVRIGNGGTPELDPFSHKVVATLEHRGVPYNLIPIDLRHKPEWFYYINRAAKVPVMFHQGSVLDSSDLILEYVDFMWPSSGGQAESPSKRRRSPSINPSFLGIGRGMILAKDEEGFQAKKSELFSALRQVQTQVDNRDTKYLAGGELGAEDLEAAPMLYHSLSLLKNMFGLEQSEEFQELQGLQRYVDVCMSNNCLYSTRPNTIGVSFGYRVLAEENNSASLKHAVPLPTSHGEKSK